MTALTEYYHRKFYDDRSIPGAEQGQRINEGGQDVGTSSSQHGYHTTLKASQIVAGGRSEASTTGLKNAPIQSILKGCQIALYRTDLQPQRHVTQEFAQWGFEGIQSKTTRADSILGVKSTFLASLQDAFTDSIPFRGFPLRYNPRLRSAIASRSRLQAKPHNCTDKYRSCGTP